MRARDSSIALASLSMSPPPGWKSGSISEGADSAIAPMGARLDPSLMNTATRTSNCAPIALAAWAAISTPSGGTPSRMHPLYPRAAGAAERAPPDRATGRELLAQQGPRARARGVERRPFRNGLGHV